MDVYFSGRDLKPYAESIAVRDLKEGDVYFAVTFLDDELLIPSLEPMVFIGTNLEDNERDLRYFQDAESYRQGIRFGSEGASGRATFYCGAEHKHIFDYEHALNCLLLCSLRRLIEIK